MRNVAKFIVGAIVLVPVLYLGSCAVITHQHAKAFAQVKERDTEAQVIQVMGQPADRERAGGPRLTKYGVPECQAPCVERLWYPNKLSLAGEAWSVELDGTGHVVHTAHLTSP